MRRLRFIFIAFLTSLLVINTTILRKTITVLLLSQDKVANATTPPANQIDLTGSWTIKRPWTRVNSEGCTAQNPPGVSGDYTGEFKVIQDGKQFQFAPEMVGNGVTLQGSVDERKISFVYTTSTGGVHEAVGTISADGNTVTSEALCSSSRGPATVREKFIWTREVSQFALTRATTTDAKSVTVDYTVEATNSGESSEPIHFEIYRSSTEDADHAKEKIGQQDIKIGENDIPNSTRSSPDKHKVQLNLPVDSLMPNTAAPYVVVVATYNGKKSTTYFRKWLLGAISHGFNRYNQDGVIGFGFRAYYHHALELDDDPGRIPDWETNMAQNLKGYDYVISFGWTETCALAQPDMAVQAGANLSKQITQWILAHRQHDGDVVDIHLIGHSRGTVVVTQALQHLSTASPSFEGGYIELTLLDPHPASNKFGQWADFGTNGKGKETDLAIAADLYTDHFQEIANDPPLMLPKGIKKIDIWYQQTRANDLVGDSDGADTMNLWGFYKVGEGQAIRNNSGLTIKPILIPHTAHNQVPNVYERQVVETGMLNRSN